MDIDTSSDEQVKIKAKSKKAVKITSVDSEIEEIKKENSEDELGEL
jgi:hypothetical protein